ncbi:Uncharacterised protein [Zhongshania aliphaticivorans]|uniref:Uncharacterized protein n=1 Tax=Zhongshania aliphaticivorans TaxID=1470434 RepID=A0A5S9N1M4_9GAMM|nr:hypothetical protein [Zhongshania aliphaticivorans]CAA0082888.1 Uncharacterised protein [Zhongshania aliphaticivorans]CAA0083906.1 Uncharacterised protein [Zhongshania aliphaticivorans]
MPGPISSIGQFLLILFLTFHFASSIHAEEAVGKSTQRIKVDNDALTEMSGIAASNTHQNIYWAHNDSGDRSRLFALNDKGDLVTELRVDGSSAFDWEDITSFKDQNGSYLLVGDIGDNMALRPFIDVYLLKEPNDISKSILHTKSERHYSLIYEDGPHDAEALAVDSAERFVYILSKRDTHPRLYRFSLDAIEGKPIPLNFVGDIRSIPSIEKHKEQRQGGISGHSPTAMAFSPKGDLAMIVTLRHTYLFTRKPGQSWLEALNRTPFSRTPNRMRQAEAGAFTADGKHVVVGSEGQPAIIDFSSSPDLTASHE